MNESKVEEEPKDDEVLKVAKEFVDKKLKEEEKAVTWELKSSQITKLEGSKLGGQLHIIFKAVITNCPSETQKEMSKKLHFAVKNPEDNCKPNVINMKAEHPCSLKYSKFSGNSDITCITMHSVALIVACLLAATAHCQRRYGKEKEKLPDALQKYMVETKVEEPPTDEEILKVAKEFVDKKLKEEEKAVTWALESSQITKLEGVNRTGQLHIIFKAKIADCPSETQKEMSKKLHFAVKNPEDNCKPNVIDMKAEHPCSLWYSKYTENSDIACTTMHSVALIVACLLAATAYCQRRYWEEKEKLPEALQTYVKESKVEEPPKDDGILQVAKDFVDKKLKEEEKAVTWALKSSQITKLEGIKLTGQLHIIFKAKIDHCPSETQKKMSEMLKFAVKDPNDNCKPNVINMDAEHPCALKYSEYTGNSDISCTTMHSAALIVACLLAATAYCQRRYWEEKEKLPDVLQKYMDESKVEESPSDSGVLQAAKEFVDKKLKEEEKAVTWALKSSQITKVEGNKLAGQLHIIFKAKIDHCPSETQKKLSQMLHNAVKNPEDNCKPNVINMEAEHPCSLKYSKFSGNSNLQCNMIRK
ncbi:hypothetical protein M513_01717 [Trichuris suis]|uniref:Cystatin domain-containing protein n=1 Tax=Trichuris suis TaxID=68888 RepID=A0A085MK68_9BILA|nr:hypothetical protein M513_01717 [Trichuris suis]